MPAALTPPDWPLQPVLERKSVQNLLLSKSPLTPSFVSVQNAGAVMHGMEARLTERLCSANSGSPQASPGAGHAAVT